MLITRFVLPLSLLFVLSLSAQVVPPHATVGGRSLPDWTAAHTQWQFSQPTNQNPAFDSDGSRATNGQAGPVFFVTGGLYSGPQPPRHYAVPETKHLLIPLLTIEVDNIDTEPPFTVPELRELAARHVETAVELRVTIDGAAVTNLFAHREMSPVFGINLPTADNLFTYFYGHSITGLVDPVVLDGFWLMVEPLSLGTHEIIFGGTYGPPNSYSYERTDIITVTPVPLAEQVGELISTIEGSDLNGRHRRLLLRSLKKAERTFARDRLPAAIGFLRVFQRRVPFSISHDPAFKDQLIQASQRIIDQAREELNPPPPGGVTILAPDAVVSGKTIGEWSAEVWKWIYSIPTNHNPLLDCGGPSVGATNRQTDPTVFYLAPVNGLSDPPCLRSFSVPENKFLMLPVFSFTIDNIDIIPPLPIPDMYELIDAAVRDTTNVHAILDGVPVLDARHYRATSPPFSFFFPEDGDNSQTVFYGHPITNLVDPIIQDGFWLMVEPLQVGEHTMNVGGNNPYFRPNDIFLDVTVTAVPLMEWVDSLSSWVERAGLAGATERRLTGILDRARHSFERDATQLGVAQLRQFQREVRARAPRSEAALEAALVRYAERIILRADRNDQASLERTSEDAFRSHELPQLSPANDVPKFQVIARGESTNATRTTS